MESPVASSFRNSIGTILKEAKSVFFIAGESIKCSGTLHVVFVAARAFTDVATVAATTVMAATLVLCEARRMIVIRQQINEPVWILWMLNVKS